MRPSHSTRKGSACGRGVPHTTEPRVQSCSSATVRLATWLQGNLYIQVATTLTEVVTGLAAGAMAGVLAGLLLGRSPLTSGVLRPIVVGRSVRITPQFPGTLYLKINDSAAELADNSGELRVRVKPAL